MKLNAARGPRDMQDIVPLAQRLGVDKAEDLAKLVRGVYGEDALEHVHGGYEDMLLLCRHVEVVLKTRGAGSET